MWLVKSAFLWHVGYSQALTTGSCEEGSEPNRTFPIHLFWQLAGALVFQSVSSLSGCASFHSCPFVIGIRWWRLARPCMSPFTMARECHPMRQRPLGRGQLEGRTSQPKTSYDFTSDLSHDLTLVEGMNSPDSRVAVCAAVVISRIDSQHRLSRNTGVSSRRQPPFFGSVAMRHSASSNFPDWTSRSAMDNNSERFSAHGESAMGNAAATRCNVASECEEGRKSERPPEEEWSAPAPFCGRAVRPHCTA